MKLQAKRNDTEAAIGTEGWDITDDVYDVKEAVKDAVSSVLDEWEKNRDQRLNATVSEILKDLAEQPAWVDFRILGEKVRLRMSLPLGQQDLEDPEWEVDLEDIQECAVYRTNVAAIIGRNLRALADKIEANADDC